MRILLLTKYGSLGASSRLRTLQYVPALRSKGWDVHVQPLLDDTYLLALYGRRFTATQALSGYMRRLGFLVSGGAYDIVWVEKEVWPWIPFGLERFIRPKRARYVADYDDAMFHRYDQHSSDLVRRVLGRKIDKVMADADVVMAGNEYLARRASEAGAAKVEIVPTVVDMARYTARPSAVGHGVPVVGWIGSPDTVRFLRPRFEVFARLKQYRDVRLVAIGARPDQVDGSPFEAVPWSEATEVELLRSLDVGIMPLQDTPWQRGKCGYKLIQYMACGVPVIASPVGVNTRIVQHGESGFLASTDDEWLAASEKLLDAPGLRARLGSFGRAHVEGAYSLSAQTPRVLSILDSLHGEQR